MLIKIIQKKKLWKEEDNEDLEFDIYEQLIIEELKNNDQYNLKSLCLEGKLRFNACYSELEEDIRYIELKIDYLSGYFEFGLITTIENTKKIIKDYYEKPLKCTNSEFKYIITQLRLLMRLKNDIEKAY